MEEAFQGKCLKKTKEKKRKALLRDVLPRWFCGVTMPPRSCAGPARLGVDLGAAHERLRGCRNVPPLPLPALPLFLHVFFTETRHHVYLSSCEWQLCYTRPWPSGGGDHRTTHEVSTSTFLRMAEPPRISTVINCKPCVVAGGGVTAPRPGDLAWH